MQAGTHGFALDAFTEEHALDEELKTLLRAVAQGVRDAELAQGLGIERDSLPALEIRFRGVTGHDVYEVASTLTFPSVTRRPRSERVRKSTPVEPSDSPVYADRRGALWSRSAGPVLEFRATGHMSRLMAKKIIELSAQHIKRRALAWSFSDWEDLETYEIEARLELTAWLLRNHAHFAQAHILTRSQLIVSGVSLARVVLGDSLQAHTDRDEYEALLEEVRLASARFVSAPPPPTLTRMALSEGMVVDTRYRIVGPLGAGAMGTVFLAEDIELARPTALKFIDFGSFDVARTTAHREARALASIRNDNVAGVYATGEHQGTPFVAMEFIRGTSFAEIISMHSERGMSLPLVPALSMLAQVARGLGAVHSAGLVHRDVKPGNVVVESGSGRPVLVDFGLAEAPPSQRDSVLVGTPAFMAPELCGAEGSPPSPQSDFYAWGVMAYELLTGALPFGGTNLLSIIADHVLTTPPVPSSRRDGLEAIDDILLKTLAKEPDDRPGSAAEIALRLECLVAELAGDAQERGDRLRGLIVTSGSSMETSVSEALRRAVSHLALEIDVAPDGRRGLLAANRNPPDIVFVANLLPDMHGLEFLASLRARQPGSRQEFVLQPESTDDEWRFRALGIQHFIDEDDPAAIAAQLIDTGQALGW